MNRKICNVEKVTNFVICFYVLNDKKLRAFKIKNFEEFK